MTFDQLLYFKTIVTLHTFSEAAIHLNISQSALSKQIANLEQELGIQLFNRCYRQIQLTEAGSIFLNDVEQILQYYQQMKKHLHAYKQANDAKVKIAMLPILSHDNFAKNIHVFKQYHHDIQIEIHEIEERDLPNAILTQEYDILILRGNHSFLSSYTKHLLYKDTLTAIVSTKHPLSQKKKITLYDLKEEALLLPPSYTKISQIAKEACLQNGFTPNIQHYGRIESLIVSVREQQGIALLMKQSLTLYHLQDVKVLDFHDKIHGDIYLYLSPLSKQKKGVQTFFTFLNRQKESTI